MPNIQKAMNEPKRHDPFLYLEELLRRIHQKAEPLNSQGEDYIWRPTVDIVNTTSEALTQVFKLRDANASTSWIPCSDRLPKEGAEVDAWSGIGGRHPDARFFNADLKWKVWGIDEFGSPGWITIQHPVTHWMSKPLPLSYAPTTN